MGVSIAVHEFDYDRLCNQFEDWVNDHGGFPEGRSMMEFENKFLPQFGKRYGDKFLMLWNEYYEDYNAALAFLTFCCRYINHDEEDTPWFDYETGPTGANAYEIIGFGDDD